MVTPRKIKLAYFRFLCKIEKRSELAISKLKILFISLMMFALIAFVQLIEIETLLGGLILFSTALMRQSIYSLNFIVNNRYDILDLGENNNGNLRLV